MNYTSFNDMRSLRDQAEKWLGVGEGAPLHVLFTGRTRARHRYVCIEAPRAASTRALFFFRHEDGAWRVFPDHAPYPSIHMPGF